VVDTLTEPELLRLMRARAKDRHRTALCLRWLARLLSEMLPYSVAVGYRMARATTESGKLHKIERLDLEPYLDAVPGYDPKLARRG
jgi:hypothetical protein